MIDPLDLERRAIEAAPDPLEHIRAWEISFLFGRKDGWFELHRAELEAEGFPRPVSRSMYLRRDVVRFILARSQAIRVDQVPALRSGPTMAEAYELDRAQHHRRRRRKRVLP